MNGTPQIVVTGNLTADPDLRFTASGKAVATFTVAHTPRVKQDNQWVDGAPLFLRCTAWQVLAEHVAQSLQRGHRVTVRGTLRTNQWTDKTAGELRTSIERSTSTSPT
jgi:single-strand DNA-binding protein